MYRNAFNTMSIYCEKENCDLKCGHFHLSRSADDKRRSRLKAKQNTKNVKSLDLLVPINGVVRVTHNHVDKNGSSNNTSLASRRDSSDQKQLSPLTPTTRNPSLGIRQESVDPLSPMSVASTITLDDIIASARRKISQDYEEPRLPSPVFLDELPSEADKHSWTGMLDIDDGFGEADSFVQHLVDSEDEMWMAEPPTILNDDDQEDFEELLK
uniref:Uncharacterized protein n=1 Tax=Acrobeloides nanus TaxID=290746 RepID=A0A914BVX2_9BILA